MCVYTNDHALACGFGKRARVIALRVVSVVVNYNRLLDAAIGLIVSINEIEIGREVIENQRAHLG